VGHWVTALLVDAPVVLGAVFAWRAVRHLARAFRAHEKDDSRRLMWGILALIIALTSLAFALGIVHGSRATLLIAAVILAKRSSAPCSSRKSKACRFESCLSVEALGVVTARIYGLRGDRELKHEFESRWSHHGPRACVDEWWVLASVTHEANREHVAALTGQGNMVFKGPTSALSIGPPRELDGWGVRGSRSRVVFSYGCPLASQLWIAP
jgi:hypothetical protein